MTAAASWWKRRTSPFRFAVVGISLMVGFYALVYYPYPAASLPARILSAYVLLQTRLCGALLYLFDPTVSTTGPLISGRFPLLIVLDCVAPDSMALYAAATLAFPAPFLPKVIGLVAGLATIAVVNVGRVVLLYVIGVNWPRLFAVMHEELLQVAVIVSVCCCFIAYAGWIRRRWRPLESSPSRATA